MGQKGPDEHFLKGVLTPWKTRPVCLPNSMSDMALLEEEEDISHDEDVAMLGRMSDAIAHSNEGGEWGGSVVPLPRPLFAAVVAVAEQDVKTGHTSPTLAPPLERNAASPVPDLLVFDEREPRDAGNDASV